MNNGIFFINSVIGITTANGVVIEYNNGIYLLSCAHTFYNKSLKNISFLIEPSLSTTNLNGEVVLLDLSLPIFHPNETDKISYEVAIIKLSDNHVELLNSKNIKPSNLLSGKFNPKVGEKAKFIGYHSNIINHSGFNGAIPLNSFEYKFVLQVSELEASITNAPKKSIDNYIFAKNKESELGSGFSGSPVYDTQTNEIIGVYHASGEFLGNGFGVLVPNGYAVIASVDKIKETIESF